MLSNIILFVTAVLGFLSTALIFGKNKYQEHSLINKYLIAITTSNAIRFLFHGIAQAYPELDISKFVTVLDVGVIMLMPSFYLYFTNIIYESKFELGNLLHFIVPFLLVSLFLTFLYINPNKADGVKKLFFFVIILFYSLYTIFGFMILYKHVWRRKTYINAIQKQNKLIKKWSIFLYVSFVLIFLIRLTIIIINYNQGTSRDNYLWITALVWMVIFVKIILSPEILYGYNVLNKTIDAATERLALSSVWNLESRVLPITSEKDRKLDEKIKPLLLEYLHQMEEFSFHTNAFRNPDLSPEDIAVALKIPISHIYFILKFHCNESFTDYKKIVRIHDATKLLEHGYLNDHKIESLATTVGFTSYNTFSIAFKNITGVTTQEYVKRF
ncbi:helix-turn-helix domain-containing protein [Flavobacterium luteum]|uniref:Helix-turn-helix transcriptional regulator n=1 Tax=Flavobacterium luteum TaxID=2026654 RepID=A0A7J5ADC7_9FLAO|nr:AraC family transcriptional regulator [Flavobacterium luteum]KAB1155591.1 helix-turn-helix transcriptional regulator [Flavobacterium luteum]